jgi:hypothetical protein
MKLLDVIAKIDAMILLLPTKFHEVLILLCCVNRRLRSVFLEGPFSKKVRVCKHGVSVCFVPNKTTNCNFMDCILVNHSWIGTELFQNGDWDLTLHELEKLLTINLMAMY